jgi:putative ABC transport system permease protein
MKSVHNVINSTAVSDLPSIVRTSFLAREWEGSEPNSQILAHLLGADYEFVNTLGLEMEAGRYYSREFLSDTADGIVLNETAVRVAGIESPIGKNFTGRKIIGVIKDFHFESLHEKIDPLVITFASEATSNLMVKINSADIHSTLENMKEKWTSIAPEFPFEYKFLDEYLEKEYLADQRIEDIINAFTFLAVLIACLGLFGLAAYTAEQRTKEIGIRKVLGSSVYSIVLLLSKEFTRWVLLANVIAWPVSYYIMSKWLEGFAYRTELDWWIFFFSGGTALLISLLTVIYQAAKAAVANPVESLRSE